TSAAPGFSVDQRHVRQRPKDFKCGSSRRRPHPSGSFCSPRIAAAFMKYRVTITVTEGPDHGQSYNMDKASVTIGRKGTDMMLTDRKVSTKHAAVDIENDRILIRDLESRNGILLNGQKVTEANLKNLDEI